MKTPLLQPVDDAIHHARTNDAKGIVSRDDASDIVRAVVGVVAAAQSASAGREVLDGAYDKIKAIRSHTKEVRAHTVLSSVGRKAGNALRILEQREALKDGKLPAGLEDALVEDFLHETYADRSSLRITNLKAHLGAGFKFNYEMTGREVPGSIFQDPAEEHAGMAYAVMYKDAWFISDRPVGLDVLKAASRHARNYFDENKYVQYYGSRAAAAEARDELVPHYGKEYETMGSTPLRIVMRNQSFKTFVYKDGTMATEET